MPHPTDRLPESSRRPTLGLDAADLLRGVSPVLETPFTETGDIDVDGFRRVVNHVLSTGVSSLMYPGFASEYYKLDSGEREELVGILIEEVRARPAVAAIIAVQDHATRLAEISAAAAAAAGADAINLLPPHLLSPPAQAVEQHLRCVLAAVPDTPVVVQYAPTETGTSLSPQRLARIAVDHPNLALVKVESSPPGPFIEALLACDPPLPAFEGYAGVQLLDAFRRGAVGTQPGCSFTEIYVEIWRRLSGGDEAGGAALHARLLPYISYWMLDTETINAAEKLISFRRGLIESPLCRAPAHRLDRQEVAMVDRFLEEFADLLVGPGDRLLA
ncbi:dihydrodipicolinate synthase family protein [Kribbella sp. NPDC003505]|uniref:dihydrodipicolinate synthase family protein n=1 Tax=Kribbella sp. NPDC003505 TaxID=3154448 RepID=UPI0033BDE29F